MPAVVKWGMALVAILLMLCLRFVALESDAYPHLSWSSGLLTDEGFYIHNARNLVLFGHLRTDEFNNALLMPTLHAVQVWVFRLFGVGAIPARMISVVASLLALLLFYDALNRAFGRRVAGIGTLFLGLDHVYLLYNRMALMDTPASLLLIAAFWAFVRAVTPGSQSSSVVKTTPAELPAPSPPSDLILPYLVLSGQLLGLAYSTRSLVLFLLPIPLIVFYKRKSWAAAGSVALGLGMALLLYIVLWYLPNREELTRISHYYLQFQLLPHTFIDIRNNIGTALFSPRPGLLLYLLSHTPVMFLIALWFTWKRNGSSYNTLCVQYLLLWLWILIGVYTVVSYAPSRYYVLFYPALAALAALGWDSLTFMSVNRAVERGRGVFLLVLWAVINFAWTGDWLSHLRYTQRDTDQWLARTLPANSVLIGDAAPGVCLNNRFKAIPVITGLCNYMNPLENAPPGPRTLVMLTGQKNITGWNARYPSLLTPENQLGLFPHLVNVEVAVYRVPDTYALRKQSQNISRKDAKALRK